MYKISERDWSYFHELISLRRDLCIEGEALSAGELRLRLDLEKYLSLLLDMNKNLNLTAIKDPSIGVWKHLYDALLLVHFEPLGSLLDWGTGGGVPGIPIALFRRALSKDPAPVDFVDSVKKKASAVSGFLGELGLGKCTVFGERGEAVLARRSYDSIVMRAVAPPERMIPWVSKKARDYIFMAGPHQREEWDTKLARMDRQGFILLKAKDFTLPFDQGTRTILHFRQK